MLCNCMIANNPDKIVMEVGTEMFLMLIYDALLSVLI